MNHNGCGTKDTGLDLRRRPYHSAAQTNTMIPDHEAIDNELEKPAPKSQIQQRLDAQIDTKWADLILLGCFFCSGLIDSMAFNMYACFVSMQTGQ